MLKKLFGLVKQEVIAPDSYLTDSKCEIVWESSYSKRNRK
jgi:hypothetical protein